MREQDLDKIWREICEIKATLAHHETVVTRYEQKFGPIGNGPRVHAKWNRLAAVIDLFALARKERTSRGWI